MRLKETEEIRRILDLDIENRPLSYWYGDATTGEITAIAWQFLDDDLPTAMCLGEHTIEEMLEEFVLAYNEADMVTGHYIRAHDLPVLNMALVEAGFYPLSNKMSQDTKLDLVRTRHISTSQESLAEMLGVDAPKVQMSQSDWREANRLTTRGIELTKERVIGDIKQHIEMRYKLLENKMLRTPRVWNSVPGGTLAVVSQEV